MSSFSKEFLDMVEQGVLRLIDSSFIKHSPNYFTSPMGAQVKNSDLIRAKVLAEIRVTDQASLDRATTVLLQKGSSKIKCRITLDPTATGINDATPSVPFRYPSIADFISLLSSLLATWD
jgi:hypothetical protein